MRKKMRPRSLRFGSSDDAVVAELEAMGTRPKPRKFSASAIVLYDVDVML
jgi:hypothetical protein